MGRGQYEFRDTQVGKRRESINPIWRGVGCLILVLLTVGGFWLAGYLLDLNSQTPFLPFALPRNFSVTIVDWLPKVPGKLLIQIGGTLIIDVFAYAIMVVVYSLVNPLRPGKTDAPQPRRRRGPGSMVR